MQCQKQQEASGLLSQLGIRTLSSKIPLLGDICFKCIKMNNILMGMIKVHAWDDFRQPGFTCSVCGHP